MIDPTMLKQATQIWENLDELASSDPKAYKEFIAQQLPKRLVMPGIAGYTKVNGIDHVLNICQSAAIAAPKDWTDIPILMSEKRTYETKEIKLTASSSNNIQIVIDAVLNEKVMEKCNSDREFSKAILNLCIGCVKELFDIDMNPDAFTFKKDFYHGEYGWDDKTGQPKKSLQKEQISVPDIPQLKTSAPPKKKPLIEEIVSPGTFELQEFPEMYILHLQLDSGAVTVKTEGHEYVYQVPSNAGTKPMAKLNGSKLKIKFSKH